MFGKSNFSNLVKNFNDILLLFSLFQMLELESERSSKWLKMLDNWDKYASSDKAIFYITYCLACFLPLCDFKFHGYFFANAIQFVVQPTY